MLSLEKALSWMFRFCGISPSGNRIDKYLTIFAMVVIISITVSRMWFIHVKLAGFDAIFAVINQPLISVAAAGFIIKNWVKPNSYMNIKRDLERDDLINTDEQESGKYIWIIIATIFLVQLRLVHHFSLNGCMKTLLAIILTDGPVMQNIMLVDKIRQHFSAENNNLVSVTTKSDTSTIRTEVDSVFRSHSSLQALVVDVDLHFCFYNLLSFMSKFLFCVMVMFRYLNSIENPNTKLDYGFLLSFFRQLVFFIVQAFVCHACSQEANRTVLLAHRVLQSDSPIELCEEVGLFSALATDNKVHFTVGGIFTLDRALITQTFLTALSYLIIAVQLREVKLFGDNVTDTTATSVLLGMNSSLGAFHNED